MQLGRYKSLLATTDAERVVLCRLKFQGFNAELGESLNESYATGREDDRFASVCNRLVVKDTEFIDIAGTYRIPSAVIAAANSGYFSPQNFDFPPANLFAPTLSKLGRARIHKDHRNHEVLTRLWESITCYSRLFPRT